MLEFTAYVPQFLNRAASAAITSNAAAVGSASPTLAAEAVTSAKIPTGALPGGRFYLTDAQAAALSSSYFPCYGGWYRVVLVDSGATAANIGYGKVGAMVTVAKGKNVVTDAANVLSLGAVPVIFLGTVTPGQYTIVQDMNEGEAALLVGTNQTIAVGSVLVATATGVVNLSGAISLATLITTVAMAEAAVTTPASLTLTAVAAASAGVAVYTGTITGGAANAFAGQYFTIAGFTNTLNNSATAQGFLCTASIATTLTLSNAVAAAETHAGTAAALALVRARLGAPFAI